jgi:AraC-like DNA-binding protein
MAASRSAASSVSLNDDIIEEGPELPLGNLYNIIVSRIENDKLYLDPNLSLGDLCQKINRKQRYVSQAINEVGKTSFSSLINSFRINEARRLLASGQGLSVNEIMEKTGFGSRPAFHRNFKAATGFTPAEYQSWTQNSPDSATEF